MVNVNFPAGLIKLLLGSAFEASAEAIKLKLAIGYLKLLHNSRNMAIQLSLLIFAIVIFSFGLILIPVSLCLYMPWTTTVKAVVSISFALLYTVIPMIALLVAFSEKRWLSSSKLEKLINDKK